MNKIVKVYFDNGDSLISSINGSEKEIEQYYLGNIFVDSNENPRKCIKVEIREKTFVENCTDLLNSISTRDGTQARLAHRLSRAINKLEQINALAESVCAHNPAHNFCDDLKRIMSEEED
jgi:hypothetical protein